MWCFICHSHRNAAAVVGPDSRRNALVNPMKLYHYRNVAGYADTMYHLAAVGLSSCFTAVLSNMPIHLPTAIIPQVLRSFVVAGTLLYSVSLSGE